MDDDEITFEDLLAAEPPSLSPAKSFEQLLADGFPQHGGLAELAAIVQMADAGPKFAALQCGYEKLFAMQRAGQLAGTEVAAAGRLSTASCSSAADVLVPESEGARPLALG